MAKAKEEDSGEFKFGVADLAEELGIEPASVRVKLRNAEIDKAGRSYGWNSQRDFDRVVKELKSTSAPAREKPAAPAKGKVAAKTAPAAKGKGKAAAPAAKGKPAKVAAKPAKRGRALAEAEA